MTIQTETFRASDYANPREAKSLRDKRARELRRSGTVRYAVCQTWDFTDLARDVVYQVHYELISSEPRT